MHQSWIIPDWKVPPWVRAFSTTRLGGTSQPPFHSLNLSERVKDDAESVIHNRQVIQNDIGLSVKPIWLKQVHGHHVVDISHLVDSQESNQESCQENNQGQNQSYEADASIAFNSGVACVVLTSDCLPVLMTDDCGTFVAAIHAGWRGLLAEILSQAVQSSGVAPEKLVVWLGPAIGPTAFEVGDEVQQAFSEKEKQAESAFKATKKGYWLADIYELARIQLRTCGVSRIYGAGWCTYNDSEHFFSYRRDGSKVGRMATLIWLTSNIK